MNLSIHSHLEKGPTMKKRSQPNNPDDFLNDLEKEDIKPTFINKPAKTIKSAKAGSSGKMTQGQKFLLAVLFFVLVLIFGFFIMLITGTMVLPL